MTYIEECVAKLVRIEALMAADVARWKADGYVLSPSGAERAPIGSEQALRWDEARVLAARDAAAAKRQGVPLVQRDGVAVRLVARKR